MQKELPLYVFIRNSLILTFLFFIISAIIIERGRSERGENSLFNGIILNQKNILEYKDYDIINTLDSDPINDLIEKTQNFDIIIDIDEEKSFNAILAQNKNKNSRTAINKDL